MISDAEKFIPQIQPTITQIEVDRVSAAVQSTWITESSETQLFEQWFSNVSCRPTTSYCNGTVALLSIGHILKMRFSNLNVAVPNMTFISSMSPFLMLDANITLLDVDKYSGQLDVGRLEEIPDEINVLVLPVLYGAICDIEEVERHCRDKGICLVIDAAQAVGQSVNGRSIFSFGDFCFSSFYGNKIITCAEGAVIMCSEEDMIEVKRMKNHGRDKKGIFFHDHFGLNFAFSDIHAALGNAQLSRLPEILDKKRAIFDYYQSNIQNDSVQMFNADQSHTSNHWFSSILTDDPASLNRFLLSHNIGSRRAFGLLSHQKMLTRHDYPSKLNANLDLNGSECFYNTFLSLPSSFDLHTEDLKRIVDTINDYQV
jgi:perosamine synthetase